MKPLVAIVGRPNVGKSTLFNRLVGERRAIVLDTPGVTRDRNYGDADWLGRYFTVIDTGGFEPDAQATIPAQMREQALLAVEEADVVVFLCDARDGLLPADHEVAEILRRRVPEKVVYAVNKVDGPKQESLAAEFYELGVETIHPVSAEHTRGLGDLLDAVLEKLPPPLPGEDEEDERVTRIALVGRPNVGKSTLSNKLLGEERMIVSDVPGTTRDAIDARLVQGDSEYLLIDTAGLRRKRGISRGTSEAYSVVRTLRALDRCHVAVVLLDATEGVTDQDARIIGIAAEKGRAIILAINKWDAVEKDSKTAKRFADEMELKLPFVSWAPKLFISGLTGQRVHKLLGLIDEVREAHRFRVGTGQLNRWLEEVTHRHQPPVSRGRRLRFYYATQARVAPPTIVLSCNDPKAVHFSYQRYLQNQLRETFPLAGTPIRLSFKGKKNPFDPDEE